tara:strand:+ start:49 stop:327 length:279 start_codon:yes stop_codon:yes gene_type:complete
MKCPKCENSISIFSKTLNTFGRTKECNNCGEKLKVRMSFKILAILIIPFFLLDYIFLSTFMEEQGISNGISTAIMSGILILLSLKLKPAKQI